MLSVSKELIKFLDKILVLSYLYNFHIFLTTNEIVILQYFLICKISFHSICPFLLWVVIHFRTLSLCFFNLEYYKLFKVFSSLSFDFACGAYGHIVLLHGNISTFYFFTYKYLLLFKKIS